MKLIITIFLTIIGIVSISATNRALIVGIGKYDSDKTGWSVIHGDSDVDIISAGLVKNGFPKTNIKTLKNNQATKNNIVNALRQLAKDCRPGDKVLFHFSGHGQPISDINGDEKNGFDESIIPYDAFRTSRYTFNGRPYQGENHLIDDQLNPLLNNIKRKIGTSGKMIVLIDACYSRGMEMDETASFDKDDLSKIGNIRGTSHKFKANANGYLKSVPIPKRFDKGGMLIIITACKETERNFEYKTPSGKIYGSLSYCISELLKKDADFSRWRRYFENKEYKNSGIFIKEQHPTVQIYM